MNITGYKLRLAVVGLLAGGALLWGGCEKNDDGGKSYAPSVKKEDKLHLTARAGLPVAGAAAYKTRNPSPTILLPAIPTTYWYVETYLPKAWIAKTVSELELVCYFGPSQSVVVQRKNYSRFGVGPVTVLERIQYKLPVSLKEAATGRTVAQTTLVGSMPRAFQSTERGDIYGSSPGAAEIQAWLTRYVQR